MCLIRLTKKAPKDIANAWEVLWRCFPNVRKAGMQVESINDISNGISLTDYIHTQFGKFSLAFKATVSIP